MKLFLVAFAVIAAVAADIAPSDQYLPPVQQELQPLVAPTSEYLPPIGEINQGQLGDDGYRYKTQRRVVLRRHRRDVNELPSNEYLPPVQPLEQIYTSPAVDYSSALIGNQGDLSDDGYRYKTNRRVVLRRHRRDVNELPSSEYLPPVQIGQQLPSNEYLPPVQSVQPVPTNIVVEPTPAHELAADGYRYKTNRRVVLRRHRRDVNELPSSEYLPPVQIGQQLPSNEYLPPIRNIQPDIAIGQELGPDGYRYKTNRRVVLRRHRRDVNELPSNEYLPPVQPVEQIYTSPAVDYSSALIGNQGDLSDDGYRYKTNRRVVLRRHRRDVNELPSSEYLPPVQIGQQLPSNEYLPPVQPVPTNIVVEPTPAHELAADGYRYKTNRRVVLRRHRRDVNELPSSEYLPPVQIGQQLPSNEYLPPVQSVQPVPTNIIVEPTPAHELAADGYRYKTNRRVVLRRHRRDVNELPSSEYLPPAQIGQQLPSNEYLPPGQSVGIPQIQPQILDVGVPEATPAHELAVDGYRYKTHRRVVYRRRH